MIDIDIPNRTINVRISDEELAKRREAMNAKGKDAWKPIGRNRVVSAALESLCGDDHFGITRRGTRCNFVG